MYLLIWVGIGACSESTDPAVVTPTPLASSGWQYYFTGIGENFNDVFFVNNSAGWVVGDNGIILSTANTGGTWPLAPVSVAPEDFGSVFFVNDDTGWLTGQKMPDEIDGTIYKSQTGGAYPEIQKIVDQPLRAIFFIDSNTGWAGGENGLILNTDDSGFNWNSIIIDPQADINHLAFIDQNNGWSVTSNGKIFRTRDGASWIEEIEDVNSDIQSIQMLDTIHGWACGSNNTILKRTMLEDGSQGWTSFRNESEFSSVQWNDLWFVNDKTGWIAGSSGLLYKTVDGGNTWALEPTPIDDDLNAIHFTENGKGFVVGDGGILLYFIP